MGCQLCNKNSQIVEPLIKEEKKIIIEEDDELKFDAYKARKLIKFMLLEDKVYRNSLNPILLFNEEQLENLFKGNDDYAYYPYHNIQNRVEFKNLLMKFEDYSDILFEWYKDESKYDNLIKLWKRNLCIYIMKDYSDERLIEELRNAELSDIDDFIVEFKTVINNSIESKASDINNYLKDEYDDFYSLITTSEDFKNDRVLSKKENNGAFTINFKNIIERLVKASFPLIKKYAKQNLTDLNILSKIKLKSKMLNKLKNCLLKQIQSNRTSNSNGIGFDNILSLINKVKNGNALKEIMNQMQMHFNNPNVAIANLTMSFMNLAISVKTYYNNSVEFDQKTKEYSNKMDSINSDFENHKKQIGLLDLDNYEASMKKIEIIGKEIYKDKLKVIEFIKNIDEEKNNTEKEKKKSGVAKAVTCGVGVVGSAIGFVATGGILAAVYGVSAIASGIAMGVNIANLAKIKKQLNIYKDFKEKENKKFDEIESTLAELRFSYNKLQERYIPLNLLNNYD